MTSITGKVQRATLQSLPKLVIPEGGRPQPEVITPSRAVQFLAFCGKYKRAPPSRIVKGGFTTTPVQLFVSAAVDVSGSTATTSIQSFVSAPDVPLSDDTEDEDIPTLEFDWRDRRELRRRTRELQHAKAQHGHWIALLNDDPRDPETLRHCRYWRRVREELGAEIGLIPERLRSRREFREEFNRKWPV